MATFIKTKTLLPDGREKITLDYGPKLGCSTVYVVPPAPASQAERKANRARLMNVIRDIQREAMA